MPTISIVKPTIYIPKAIIIGIHPSVSNLLPTSDCTFGCFKIHLACNFLSIRRNGLEIQHVSTSHRRNKRNRCISSLIRNSCPRTIWSCITKGKCCTRNNTSQDRFNRHFVTLLNSGNTPHIPPGIGVIHLPNCPGVSPANIVNL